MANNNDYWIERDAKALNNLTDKSIAATNKQLINYYVRCQKKIITQFETLYSDLWGKESISPADLYKLDKYWKIQGQLQQELNKLGDNSTRLLAKKFIEQYKNIYKNIALPSEEAFATIDDAAAAQVIKQIWCADGKDWSSRIWTNTAKLQNSLNEQLIHSVIIGENPSELKKKLINEFGVSYNSANMLVRTEMSHLQNVAAIDRYKNYGIKEYEILADNSCDDCLPFDKKRFSINEPSPVPFHPNCRCCVIPVIEIEEKDNFQ